MAVSLKGRSLPKIVDLSDSTSIFQVPNMKDMNVSEVPLIFGCFLQGDYFQIHHVFAVFRLNPKFPWQVPAARSQLEASGLEVHRFDSPVKTPLTEAHGFLAKQHIKPMGFFGGFFWFTGKLPTFQKMI